MALCQKNKFKMLRQQTFQGFKESICLLESVAGNMRCVSRDGLRIGQCGQDHAHASRSAVLEKVKGLKMKDTSGQKCSDSSKGASLQSFLESRLQALPELTGCKLYKLTLKERVTKSGNSIYALRASVPRTFDKDFTGWPTASAMDWKDSAGMATEATNPDGPRRVRLDQLPRVASLAGWGTPTATEAGGDPEAAIKRKEDLGIGKSVTQLAHQVRLSLPVRLKASGQIQTGSSVVMESGGKLNPEHSRWLMGYQEIWSECAPGYHEWKTVQRELSEREVSKGMETPSSPKLRRGSSNK